MNLQTAKTFFTQDQLNWNRPHLRWLSNKFYRLKSAVTGRR